MTGSGRYQTRCPRGSSAVARSGRSAAARATSSSSWKPPSRAAMLRKALTAGRTACPLERHEGGPGHVTELAVEAGESGLGGVVAGHRGERPGLLGQHPAHRRPEDRVGERPAVVEQVAREQLRQAERRDELHVGDAPAAGRAARQQPPGRQAGEVRGDDDRDRRQRPTGRPWRPPRWPPAPHRRDGRRGWPGPFGSQGDANALAGYVHPPHWHMYSAGGGGKKNLVNGCRLRRRATLQALATD